MLSHLNQCEKVLLTAYWAVCDAQPPRKSERFLAVNYTTELWSIAQAAGRIGPRKDPRRLGTQLPRQRKVRASKAV